MYHKHADQRKLLSNQTQTDPHWQPKQSIFFLLITLSGSNAHGLQDRAFTIIFYFTCFEDKFYLSNLSLIYYLQPWHHVFVYCRGIWHWCQSTLSVRETTCLLLGVCFSDRKCWLTPMSLHAYSINIGHRHWKSSQASWHHGSIQMCQFELQASKVSVE